MNTFGLTLLIITPIIIDGVFTLVGQPMEYWSDRKKRREYNPVGQFFLELHPLAFALAFIPYGVAVFLALAFLPKFLATLIAVTLFISHAYGSSTWTRSHQAFRGLICLRNLPTT